MYLMILTLLENIRKHVVVYTHVGRRVGVITQKRDVAILESNIFFALVLPLLGKLNVQSRSENKQVIKVTIQTIRPSIQPQRFHSDP